MPCLRMNLALDHGPFLFLGQFSPSLSRLAVLFIRKEQAMKKKDRERFVNQATQLLLDLGAKEEQNLTYDFTLQTKVGPLWLQITENTTKGPGTVFTRFADPEAAKALVDCNPHSGKWNHFFFEGTVETAIKDLTFWLRKVLP